MTGVRWRLLVALIGAVFAHAAIAAVPTPQVNLWKVVFLGIPLGVLAASMTASAFRSLREPTQPDTKIPAKLGGIVLDGLIGGWLAMLLIGLPWTTQYVGPVRAEVLGGVCALGVQWLRDNAPRYIEQVFQTALAWFARKRVHGGAGGEP